MVIRVGHEPDPRKRIRQSQGGKLRQARKLRNLSPAELAELIGVTPGAISHWETGRFSPRAHHQVALAKALDVPWSFIFGLDEAA